MEPILNPMTGKFEWVGSNLWKCLQVEFGMGEVKNLEVFPLTDFNSLTYIITVVDGTGKRKRFNFDVINDEGVIKDGVYAKMGTNLRYDIDAIINGTDMELVFSNNETFDLTVHIARLMQ